jgi:uncharacterized protein YkwD
VKLTRTALFLALLLSATCERPRPVPADALPLSITAPPPGKPSTEVYPSPSLPAERVKREVFEQINQDRAQRGLDPVAWDDRAARLADVFCAAQVAEKTSGHFLRDGVPPYARTGLAGVFGYQAENSASWTTTASTFSESPLELALSAQRSMMEETPPDDGHRRTILDPRATHVGVGWAMTGGQFQMAEEFLTRWLERLTLETEAHPAVLRVKGAARAPLQLRFVTIAREPLPVPLTQTEASSRTTYRYPKASEAFVPKGHTSLRVVGMLTRDQIRLGRDRDFSFSFAPQQPGLFTFVFWVAKSGDDRPEPGGSTTIQVEP